VIRRIAALGASLLLAAGATALDLPPGPEALPGSGWLRPPPLEPVRTCEAPSAEPVRALPPSAAAAPRPRAGVKGKKKPAAAKPAAEAATRNETVAPPPQGAPAPSDVGLAAAMRAARRADTSEKMGAAAEELARAVEKAAGGPDVSCAELERARLELRRGRLEEAAAAATRAARASDGLHADEASFLRAEALYRSHWIHQATPIYESLARSKNARLAAAARLRLADLHFDESAASAHAEYESLLEGAETFGADALAWAPRAAEAALAAGDPAAARRWLERYGKSAPSKEAAARAHIRIADTFVMEGQVGRAVALLASTTEEQGDSPTGALARLRALELQPPAASATAESRAFLEQMLGAESPALSSYGGALLARALVAAGELDPALDVLSRASAHRVPPGLTKLVADAYDAALQAVLAGGSDTDPACVTLVRRLGGRAALLVGRARAPDAFLALGSCYTRLGLPQASLEIYRDVLHSYGTGDPESLALHVAETALAAGDTLLARRVLESRNEKVRATPAHQLLLAEVELAEKRPDAAAALLAPLTASDARGSDRLRATVGLARAASDLADPAPYREALDDAVRALAKGDTGSRRAQLGEAAFLTGRLHRRAGDAEHARACFAIAVESLPPGAMRSEAAYWRASVSESALEATLALDDAAAGDASPWSRLARNALAIDALRSEIETGGAAPKGAAAR
jgi:tetratricopeptide (TPR) repeat protein